MQPLKSRVSDNWLEYFLMHPGEMLVPEIVSMCRELIILRGLSRSGTVPQPTRTPEQVPAPRG